MRTTLFLCAMLALSAVSCKQGQEHDHDSVQYKETDGIVLDADVPGTTVFLEGKKLGVVPVILAAKELAEMGIPNPRTMSNVVFDLDGFGETVFIQQNGIKKHLFMFAVPEEMRANYVPVETPWGMRTRNVGGSLNPGKTVRVKCDKQARRDGLSLKLECLNPVSENKAPWKFKVTLVNRGNQAVAGVKPSILIAHSRFSPGWQSADSNEITLPNEWASIAPRATLQTEISVKPPEIKGDYGLYVIFSLFKNSSNNILAGDGWCYSNTKLLSVK